MNIKDITEALEEGEGLKTISQAYAEIANLKIKRIRGLVERNRYFFEEISKVYGLIKRLAQQKGVNVKKPKGVVSVILTSNYKFYGSINEDLIKSMDSLSNPTIMNPISHTVDGFSRS